MSTKIVRPYSVLLIAVLALSAVTITVPVVAGGPIVAVNPSTQTFGPAPCVGTHFSINVSINDVTDLYGLDIQLKWNTTWIRYVGHQKMVPVEAYPGGVLRSPTVPLKDDVNETASMPYSAPGTMYWLAEGSISPATPFDGNGLAFVMEFVIVDQPSAGELDVTTGICFTYVSLLDSTYTEIPGVSLTDGAVTIKAECVHQSEGKLYAGGTCPGNVYEYAGGTLWNDITVNPPELGFSVLCLATYNDVLYAGTMSGVDYYLSVGKVWKYVGSNTWTQVGSDLDNMVNELVVYKGDLYAATAWNGAKLYKLVSETWKEQTVVSSSLSWLEGIRCACVWEDWLYLGDINYDRIGRFDGTICVEVFANLDGSCIWDFLCNEGWLYASALNGKIYGTTSGTSWTNQLALPELRDIWEMELFKGEMYFGTDWCGVSMNRDAWLCEYNGGSAYSTIWTESVVNLWEGIISMSTGGGLLYIGMGEEITWHWEYSYLSAIGKVYAWDGTAPSPWLISGTLGIGVQSLLWKPEEYVHLDAEPPVLIDRTDPVGTAWHELYPHYCNWHYLAGWFDSNNNSILDHCDHIILDNETGYSGLYNVEDVTVTLRLTSSTLNETMYVEFDGSFQDFNFSNPVNTTWYEVCPEYGNWFNLTFWNDTDLTYNLTSSDQIRLGNATDWHVDAVKTDLLVAFEKYPDFGDAPDFVPIIYPYPSKLFKWLGNQFPPNTISYWMLDEGQEQTARDSVDGNNGTLVGPAWIEGVRDVALSFDGSNDYVNVPDPVDGSLDFGAGKDFSVQAWIKPSVVGALQTKTIVDKRTGSPELGYAVFIWEGRLGLRLADVDGSTSYCVPVDMSIAVDGLWHFVFVSVDRDNCATFCVDGEEFSIPIGHQETLANNAPLWIGGNHLSGSSYYFPGGIDEVAIYNRSLTSREVRQLYQWKVRVGASHVDWNYERLGYNVNGELDSKQLDNDEFDDGVKAEIDLFDEFLHLAITITTSGQPGRYDTSLDPDPSKLMYLNAWIDWNQDNDWADDGEKIVGTGSATGTQAFTGEQTEYYMVVVPESASLDGGNWLRVRLDYGEDVGENRQSWTDPSLVQYKGQAMFGEVEDYRLNVAVAISDVKPIKYVTCEGYSGKINITVANQGGYIETFNVTVYANATAIGTQTVASLLAGATQTFSLNWNTTGFAKGSYTISACVLPLPYENGTSDNIKFADGWSKVTILGDVDGDFTVTILDVVKITGIYASEPGDPGFNPNSDINNDGHITILDVVICTGHYGQKWP